MRHMTGTAGLVGGDRPVLRMIAGVRCPTWAAAAATEAAQPGPLTLCPLTRELISLYSSDRGDLRWSELPRAAANPRRVESTRPRAACLPRASAAP